MSIDIGTVGQTQSAAPAQGVASAQAAPETEPSAAVQQAVSLDTFPAAPPPELSAAIATAARAHEALQSSGRRLHFAIDPPTGRLMIELHNLTGHVLSTVNPSQVLAAAGGADPS